MLPTGPSVQTWAAPVSAGRSHEPEPSLGLKMGRKVPGRAPAPSLTCIDAALHFRDEDGSSAVALPEQGTGPVPQPGPAHIPELGEGVNLASNQEAEARVKPEMLPRAPHPSPAGGDMLCFFLRRQR